MKIVNINKESCTHYAGRGSIFGNPFEIGKDGTRHEVCEKYEPYARNNPDLLEEIRKLPEDAVLGCFCLPKECHCAKIIKLKNEMRNQNGSEINVDGR